MEWAQWALEVARVIAWPLVIMAVLRWLREPIRERLGNVEKVSALGVDLELAARRVEREVREVADVLVDSATSAGVSEELQQSLHERVDVRDEVQVDVTRGAAPAGPAQTVYPDPIQSQLTDAQRSAIGELVQQAAEWGRVRERAGLPVEGAHLDWRDGLPTWVSPTTPQLSGSLRRRTAINPVRDVDVFLQSDRDVRNVRRLEERVDELDKERRRARHSFASPLDRVAAEERYKEAVNRLRAADPDSPYLS